MKFHKITLQFFIIFAASTLVWAEDNTGRSSIGVQLLKWNEYGVSFRKWKDDTRGRELVMSNISSYFKFDKTETSYQMPTLHYNILERKPVSEGIYYVGGIGLGLDLGYTSYCGCGALKWVVDTTVGLRFPAGIEHFFLEKYPNVSYSLQLDPHISLNYMHKEYLAKTSKEGRVTVGFAPAVFLRVYFK